MIENILILDTETTGLDPKKCQVIEIGAILYNVKHKAVLQTLSFFMPCETNPVEHINHIKAEWTRCNPNTHSALCFLRDMNKNANILVAHNASFDKKFIATIPNMEEILEKKWICTKENFTWPVKLNRLRLEDVCNAMGVPYVNAHRALSDCFLLASCFEKVVDLEERFNNLIYWIDPNSCDTGLVLT